VTDLLRFVVPGEPVPKGRPRTRVVVPHGGKPFAQVYTPKETQAYETKVRLLCQAAVGASRWRWDESDVFWLSVRVYRTHAGKGGDWDNYAKAAADAMNKLAFPDDRRIRHAQVWVDQDAERPRMVITVKRVPAKGRAA
jgi:Holliday junction resolvase RusA-like endonuclease